MQQPLVDGEGRKQHAEQVDEILYGDGGDPEGEVLCVVIPDHGNAGEVAVHDDKGDHGKNISREVNYILGYTKTCFLLTRLYYFKL